MPHPPHPPPRSKPNGTPSRRPIPPRPRTRTYARSGVGYLRFARDEPGLFRAAYTVPSNLEEAFSPDKAGPGGRTPFQLLDHRAGRDGAAGLLPPERRPGAELCAWSAVHGLAMLVLEGPLRDLDEATLLHAGQQLIEMVDRGL